MDRYRNLSFKGKPRVYTTILKISNFISNQLYMVDRNTDTLFHFSLS